MVPQRLVGALVVLSFACTASAQTTTSKPKPTKKPTVAAKPAPPPPEPAPPPAPPPASGVHLRTRYVTGAQVSENTTYLTSGRQRFEFPGITMINQCDMQRSVQLHDAARRFMVIPTGVSPAPSAPPAAAPEADTAAQVAAMSAAGGRGGASSKPKAGVITETITLTDTGERKQMFGLEARRIRTVVTRQPGPDACETKATRLETDGWYADLPELASCSSAPSRSTPASATPPQACIDHVVTQESGGARLGFALSTVVTTTIADASASEKDRERDKEVSTMSMEVVDLKVASLDKALFEVPADYTEVKDFKALLPSLANGGSLSDAVFGSVADGTSSVAPKKEGVIRVGVVTPANKSAAGAAGVEARGQHAVGIHEAAVRGASGSGRHARGARSRRGVEGLRLRPRQRHRRTEDVEAEQGGRHAEESFRRYEYGERDPRRPHRLQALHGW